MSEEKLKRVLTALQDAIALQDEGHCTCTPNTPHEPNCPVVFRLDLLDPDDLKPTNRPVKMEWE